MSDKKQVQYILQFQCHNCQTSVSNNRIVVTGEVNDQISEFVKCLLAFR